MKYLNDYWISQVVGANISSKGAKLPWMQTIMN
jgi:hypothetical protein